MEQMNNFGFNLKLCHFKTWCAKIVTMGETKSAPGHNPVRKMLEAVATSKCVLTEICDFFCYSTCKCFYSDEFLFSYKTTFDTSNLQKRLEDSTYPELSPELIKTYLINLTSRNVITKPCVEYQGRLLPATVCVMKT